ncbi:MAG TPA: alpha/beta hydrolase [Acetobacteraceae bacterium]|nr:alpha/beta hydrolase [Acetobacteraceae bacterium]
MHRTVCTPTLEIAYEAYGPDAGPALILLHGFPDDPRAWDDVAPPLAQAGWRVLVPWLRGYGPTRFLREDTPRSGQQAALGADLLGFMDGLGVPRAMLAGYDWGGRAACIVAALWPERVRGLVSITGYNIQDIAAASRPASAAQELRLWYQWYFHTERGRAGLTVNRHEICRLLWRLWSPNWHFGDATYKRTAPSFDNPDFVDVVIQSYRHRYANAPGDPALEPIERHLAAQPRIGVPTINLHGAADDVTPAEGSEGHARHFSAFYERRVIPVAGHFLPREAPEVVIAAIRALEKEVVP